MPKKGTSDSSAEITMKLLTLLAERESVGVRESARELSVSPSTALRLLKTLTERDYAFYSESTKTYSIGTSFVQLAARVYQGFSLARIARPALEELFGTVNETVNLGILTKDLTRVIHIDKVVTNRVVRIDTGIGHEAPSYCTGLGKAMLAFKPLTDVRNMLDVVELVPKTANTITSAESIIEILHRVRSQGYAEDREEFAEHLECIAAPILNRNNEVVAALSISRLSIDHLGFDNATCEQLISAARRVSAQLTAAPNIRFP